MSAACAPGIAAAAAKPADVAIRNPVFLMGHSSCCSECPRTAIAGCTLRTVLPPNPFRSYVSKKSHFFQFFLVHLDDRRYLNACSDVNECAERLYRHTPQLAGDGLKSRGAADAIRCLDSRLAPAPLQIGN